MVGNGGKIRFDIAVQGDGEIIILNRVSPYSIKYLNEIKIEMIFNGYVKDKKIKIVKKSYWLGCAYKDDKKKTGIYIVNFMEYGGEFD